MIVFISTTGHRIEYVDTSWARRNVLPGLQRRVARGLLRVEPATRPATEEVDRFRSELATAA